MRDLEEQLAGELEQCEEGDDEHRNAALRVEKLGELKDSALAKLAKDGAHVLAH